MELDLLLIKKINKVKENALMVKELLILDYIFKYSLLIVNT